MYCKLIWFITGEKDEVSSVTTPFSLLLSTLVQKYARDRDLCGLVQEYLNSTEGIVLLE